MAAVGLSSLLTACTENTLRQGDPSLALSAEGIDFGEVILGRQVTIGVSILNEGRGDLELQGLSLADGASVDFTALDLEESRLAPGAETELKVRYQPGEVGQDWSAVELVSNDPDQPLASLPLTGFGTEPLIEVDPEILWFGDVVPGEERERELSISVRGSGTLKLQELSFADPAFDGPFRWSLPEGVVLPQDMVTGTALTVTVTFAPEDLSPFDGDLVVASNDPTTPEVGVRLLGNAQDDPTDNAAPVVEITSPDAGTWHLQGDTVALRGVTWDEEDKPESLVALFYADETLLGSVVPDAEGVVSLDSAALPVGSSEVVLRVLDTDGAVGEDRVEVEVFDPDEPLPYILSGGPTVYDYWSVDDDITISVDGVVVFQDANHTADTHPPVELEASLGSTLRLLATDQNYCLQSLSSLTLFFGNGHSQPIFPGACRSACPEDSCYEAGFEGPWPATFVDESVVITIP